MKSVYIHIPFCNEICTYCDFCKMYYDKNIINNYLDALEKEIKDRYKGETIKTIYIGGGTPNILNILELNKLFKIIDIFNKDKLEEYTIECNIELLDKEKLILFKEKGINRLSLGIQSFNDKILTILGRKHNKNEVFDKIKLSKEIGFNNINIDLIYGIKDQSIETLKKDLDLFLRLDINHISLYSLIIEPNTMLYINKYREIDESLNKEMYDYICNILDENNYKHYEISNYSKEGYKSLHNLVYWHNEEYYGFGLGASSYIDNERFDNTRNIFKYIEGNYILNKEILTKRQTMEYEMILGLRLIEGVNKDLFYQKYGEYIEDVFDIKELIDNKLLIDNHGYIYIPKDKLFIQNEILINFI